MSLPDFIEEDDRIVFGRPHSPLSTAGSLQNIADLVNIQVVNTYSNLQGLYLYLDGIDLLDPEHIRPSWDAYFMVRSSPDSYLSSRSCKRNV